MKRTKPAGRHITNKLCTSLMKKPTASQRLLRIGASPFLLGCPSLSNGLGKLANVDQNRLSYCPAYSEFDLATALVKQTIDFGISMEASTDDSIASISIAVVPLSVALASSHPLADQASCRFGDLKDALFCLPCADRFPSLSRALWSQIEKNVKGALAVDFHWNMEELERNAACGACCPCLYSEIDYQKKQTSLIAVNDAAPLSLFLNWRKNSEAGQLIEPLAAPQRNTQYY